MGVIVQFDLVQWRLLFPQFSNVTDMQLEGPIWAMAQAYCRNDGGGPVCNVLVQTQLLNLMVAHIAQLLYGSTAQPKTGIVGRVSNATEGSVSVGVEFPMSPDNAWYAQTEYGAMWWQLALPYRLMRYYPKMTQQVQPVSLPNPPFWYQ